MQAQQSDQLHRTDESDPECSVNNSSMHGCPIGTIVCTKWVNRIRALAVLLVFTHCEAAKAGKRKHVVTPQGSTEVFADEPQDKDDFCLSWAEQGECEKNPLYMEVSCAHSCRRVRIKSDASQQPIDHVFFQWNYTGKVELKSEPGSKHIWQGTESSGAIDQFELNTNRHTVSHLHVARKLMPLSNAAMLLSKIQRLEFNKNVADSIDGELSFEHYILEKGKVVDPTLFKLIKSGIKHKFVPYVRRVLACPSCTLCDALIRRYLPGERRGVKPHRDILAFATGMVTLNAEGFQGGYFVTQDSNWYYQANQQYNQQLVLPVGTGDLLVHGYKVLHGVNVTQGQRYSLVLWFKDRDGFCDTDNNPWHEELAEMGDVEAAFSLGQTTLYGLGGREKDAVTAKKWIMMAADGGHAEAMTLMSRMLHHGQGGPADLPGAVHYLRRAADMGRRDAMAILSWYLDRGIGTKQDSIEAMQFRRQAAELGHPGALNELAQLKKMGQL